MALIAMITGFLLRISSGKTASCALILDSSMLVPVCLKLRARWNRVYAVATGASSRMLPPRRSGAAIRLIWPRKEWLSNFCP